MHIQAGKSLNPLRPRGMAGAWNEDCGALIVLHALVLSQHQRTSWCGLGRCDLNGVAIAILMSRRNIITGALFDNTWHNRMENGELHQFSCSRHIGNSFVVLQHSMVFGMYKQA